VKAIYLALAFTLGASHASAEPMFLAKQYTRCTSCHYSPTGGGLLTSYGRQLSDRELSTTHSPPAGSDPAANDDVRGEQAFLFGALGDSLGPAHLGLELRPSHLRIGFPGGQQDMNLLMTSDLVGAMQKNGWTAYGSAGRQPPNAAIRNGRVSPDAAFVSYEHWISYQAENGLGVRAGRFLPAYGIRLADHTAYTRRPLDFDFDDQVYGVEVSDTVGASLLQVTASPGKAEAILHDRQHRGFATSARWQLDLTPRTTLVGSALYRDSTRRDPRSGSVGGALGVAPTRRVSIWTEVDARLQPTTAGGRSWAVVNETSLEAYRGVWLKVSPQLLTAGAAAGASDVRRLALEAVWLPRTHWNVNVSYYRDRTHDVTTSVMLSQLHLYL